MSCKTFHFSIKLKELSALPLPCPVLHHLCSAHSVWGFSLIPFSRSGSPLNSLSVQVAGTGKTDSSLFIPCQQCFPLCPENCQCTPTLRVGEELLWVAYPGPGERDNRRTRLPRAASHLSLVEGRSPRAHPDTLQKAEQQELGAAKREGPDTLSKRMKNITVSKMVLPLCWYWHTDLANRLSKANNTHIANWLLQAAISCP